MGEFLNQYVTDLQNTIPLAIVAVILLAVFSILYNHWIAAFGEKKDGYTAILVAVGNFVTLLVVAIFSWKAALIVLMAFVISGTPMVAGDVYRSIVRRERVFNEARKTPRRKPLPYFASERMNNAYDELIIAERKANQVINEKKFEQVPLMAICISKALRYILEAKSSEGE